MGLRMKTLVFCAFTEKSDVQGGDSRKADIKGELPKKGGLGQFVCRFKGGGGLGKKEGDGVFEGGLIPRCTL